MQNQKPVFPFGAIVGQERVKLALLLSAINPHIGGVLITGDRGTGKSAAVNALCGLLASMDGSDGGPEIIEADPWTSPPDFRGALNRAPGRIIAVLRGADRMDPRMAESLVDAAAVQGRSDGRLRIVTLAALADQPPPLQLRPFCMRFGMYVSTEPVTDPEERLRILRYCERFDLDPASFVKKFEPDQQLLRDKVGTALRKLPAVGVREEIFRRVSDFCAGAGMKGLNADITTLRTARTIAAFDGRDIVREDDARAAIELTMPHRMWEEIIERGGSGWSRRLQDMWTASGRRATVMKPAAAEEPPSHTSARARGHAARGAEFAACAEIPSGLPADASRLLIVVADTSGLGAAPRVAALKAAVPELIGILPRRHDRVALIAARGQDASIALPPGRDRTAAAKKCRQLQQGGGKTPLPDALSKALALAREEIRKDPSVHPMLIVISEGRANVSSGKNVMLDLEEAASAIAKYGFPTLIIDPEGKGTRAGMAASLALRMRATYKALEKLEADQIVAAVRETLLK
jgi:magnesium chelatase subunit D